MKVPENAEQEDTLVPLSALQHYLFCPRQCALIHVEQLWAEDGATAEGRLLHERTDGGRPDRRQGIKILRSLTLRSFTLGVSGKADVVEMRSARKDVLVAYQERKKDELTHPFLAEKVTLGLVPHVQAQLLARYLRGDTDGYPAFIWK